MRKNAFMLLILSLFCLGAVNYKNGSAITTTTDFVGTASTKSHVIGVTISADLCTAMGASGTYNVWANNDYSGDTDQACVNSGASTVQGTVTGATIDTWTNHSVAQPTGGGTYGVKIDASDEFVSYPITAGDLINTSEGTLVVQVYLAASTGNNTFFTADGDADNNLVATINSLGQIKFVHEGNNSNVDMTGGDSIPDTTWTVIKVAWSVTSNEISVKVGANAWDVDADASAVTALATAATTLYEGDGVRGQAGIDAVYYDNFRVSETYQDASL